MKSTHVGEKLFSYLVQTLFVRFKQEFEKYNSNLLREPNTKEINILNMNFQIKSPYDLEWTNCLKACFPRGLKYDNSQKLWTIKCTEETAKQLDVLCMRFE